MKKKRKKETATNVEQLLVQRNELVLAEMIANSEALRLRFRVGNTGVSLRDRLYVPRPKVHGCCAIGAYLACKASPSGGGVSVYKDFAELTGLQPGSVFRGNDREFEGWSDPDEAVGVAYRAYHTVDG